MMRLWVGFFAAFISCGGLLIWSWWTQPDELGGAAHLSSRAAIGDTGTGSESQPAANAGLSNAADSTDVGSANPAIALTSATVPDVVSKANDSAQPEGKAEAASQVPVDPITVDEVTQESTQQEPTAPPTADTTANDSVATQTVDLLRRIELPRDVVKGDWQFDSGQLSSPPEVNQARIEIPIEPPAQYRLRMIVERGTHGKYTTLGLGLVGGGRQFYVLLDSNEAGGSLGLDLLDGKSWNQNSTTRKVQVFKDRQPAEVICTVLVSGVQVQVDGRTVLDWKGDYQRLSLYPAWAVPHKRLLFLGTDCNYVISQFELTPLDEPAAAIHR